MRTLQTVDFFDRACATEKGIPLGATVILTGPPGSGKTTLARQLVRSDSKKNRVLVLDDTHNLSIKELLAAFNAIKKKAAETNTIAIAAIHMTKEGDVAGPIAIQASADVIVSLWPNDKGQVVLETHKSRFRPVPAVSHKLTRTATGLRLT
jgi:predicted ATP-dependent serine protease